MFEDYEKNLSEVEVEYTYEKATEFKPDESGTILEISNLKSKWTWKDIERVSNTLKRMKSPFKGANDFDVTLQFINCPTEFEKYADLELSDILEKAHYKLFGLIDKNGIMQFEYDSNVPDSEKIRREGEIDLKSFGLKLNEKLNCGGFAVNLHHYSKDGKSLQKSGINKKDIEKLSGVSVYRDGIRILPCGESGNDWLKLDNERIQKTDFIGNDTIIGMVELNQAENPLLKDKTNREGLIENDEYYQFETLVFKTVDFLYKEKKSDKPKKPKPIIKPEAEVGKQLDEAKKIISDLTAKFSQSSNTEMQNFAAELKNVGSQFDGIKTQVAQTVEDFESVNKQLFSLAGTGLAAERFTHEFARLVSGANSSLVRLRNQIQLVSQRITPEKFAKINKEIDTIGGALEALRNDIRLLGPMFYIKRVASDKELNIRQIIDNTLLLQENAINKEGINIEVEGESFTVTMREGSCMQIFNNLIDNAVFWLSRKSENDDKNIKIILDHKSNSVFVSDSGPGVVSRYRDKIFEPFFSMKGEDGRGLGLYIIKEILQEKNWDIILVNQEDFSGLLKGASFKIIFTTGKD